MAEIREHWETEVSDLLRAQREKNSNKSNDGLTQAQKAKLYDEKIIPLRDLCLKQQNIIKHTKSENNSKLYCYLFWILLSINFVGLIMYIIAQF